MGMFRSGARRKTPRTGIASAALAVFVLLLLPVGAAQAATVNPAARLSKSDQACLVCHGTAGMSKALGSRERLSLHVDADGYARSVHQGMGCTACHSAVEVGAHPQAAKKIESSRAYSVDMAQICRQCHDDKYLQYEGSIHAALLKQGNPIAPVCTDCHGAHEVQGKATSERIEAVPCRKCHEGIYGAYIESVHGRARTKSGPGKAPICADCHRAHDVPPASTGDRPRDACLACHATASKAHEAIFPNAARHLEAISCAACHAPAAQRKIDLRLFDAATKTRVSADEQGSTELEKRIRAADAQGTGLDPNDVWHLLKRMNGNGGVGRTTLRGRLEVQSGVEAHQLADKSRAIRECETCHRQGAAPFQMVTISVVGPDGRPMRYEVQKEVLSSALSVDAVRGFYAIGGTRIALFDLLLALALLAGVSVPLLHLIIRRWLRGRPHNGGDRRDRQ